MAQNYVLLERIELNASAASVTFSNIPQSGYTDLKVVVSLRNTLADVWDNAEISFNNSTTGYTQIALRGNGSAASSFNSSTQTSINYWYEVSANATASTFSNAEIYVPNYLSSNYKSVSIDSVTEQNATSAAASLTAGLWSNTAAINTIKFAANGSSFVSGCTFSLYGLAATGTTPVIAPKASGGNITTDGTYWYHTFLATGTFTPSLSLSADILQIAGGGGGGGGYIASGGAGGGGAGGLLAFTSQALTTTNYTVTVGAGGSSNASGTYSQFGALTTSVGGGGGGNANTTGGSGGSGGGGGYISGSGAGGAGTAGQGYAGGNGGTSGYGGGGGGGAGGVGSGGSGAATGGSAVNTYSSWASATYTGVSGYYAGGGGGGSIGGSGAGGGGGAGAGSTVNYGSGSAATVNTGSGGGGAGDTYPNNTPGSGGNGGSGIVIIRYAMA